MRNAPKGMKKAHCIIKTFIENISDGKREFHMSYADFSQLTYAAKQAAEEVGLKFKYGRLTTGNNHGYCRYLYFPGSNSGWFKNGNRYDTFSLSEVYIIRITRKKKSPKGEYHISLIDTMEKPVWSIDPIAVEFQKLSIDGRADYGENDVTLNRNKLLEFLTHYNQWLIRLGIIQRSSEDCLYGITLSDFQPSSDQRFPNEKGPFLCWISGEKISCLPNEEIDYHRIMAYTPGDEILFAATVFSLMKPLFKLCNMKTNTEFVLQLQLKSEKPPSKYTDIERQNYEDALWFLELQTHMWCDYRDWPVYHTDLDFLFRKEYHSQPILNFTENQGFPVVFFGYKWPNGKGEDESDKDIDLRQTELEYVPGNQRLSPDELSNLCVADCLPILIPVGQLKKGYPVQKCLTLTLDFPHAKSYLKHRDPEWPEELKNGSENDPNYVSPQQRLSHIHKRINSRYMDFMQLIDGYPLSLAKKCLRNCYKHALKTLGIKPRAANPNDEHTAAILSTLYFLWELLPDPRIDSIGANQMEVNLYIKRFESYLGVLHFSDFVNFIEECVGKQVGKNAVIFFQDEEWIYLRYKQYWPAFRKYCEENQIILTVSAASFRRNVLAKEGLITPQYKTSSNAQYPRYDYRKTVNGVEEEVLKLSRKIFDNRD